MLQCLWDQAHTCCHSSRHDCSPGWYVPSRRAVSAPPLVLLGVTLVPPHLCLLPPSLNCLFPTRTSSVVWSGHNPAPFRVRTVLKLSSLMPLEPSSNAHICRNQGQFAAGKMPRDTGNLMSPPVDKTVVESMALPESEPRFELPHFYCKWLGKWGFQRRRVLAAKGRPSVTCRVVEGEAVIDNVIRPHAESIVHQGSHTVIPSTVHRAKRSVGPWDVNRKLPSPTRATSLTCCAPRWQLWVAPWCPMCRHRRAYLKEPDMQCR